MPYQHVQLLFNRCGKIVFDLEAVGAYGIFAAQKETAMNDGGHNWGLTNYSSNTYYIINGRYKTRHLKNGK